MVLRETQSSPSDATQIVSNITILTVIVQPAESGSSTADLLAYGAKENYRLAVYNVTIANLNGALKR